MTPAPGLALLLAGALLACTDSRNGPSVPGPVSTLVFTRTSGFRHSSIPAAITAVQTLGVNRGFEVEATEEAGAFNDENLTRFSVVIFLHTTGDVLDQSQQAAFERFIRAGGGFVGVHSAADTEYDWPWYGGLVGAWFDSHPAVQQATLTVADPTHQSTTGLPSPFTRVDEWYNFRENPAPAVSVLVTIDETSYTGGTMGTPHPVSWYHEYDGGRAWYTAMGHTEGSWSEPAFLDHVAGGILWAGRPGEE